MRRLIRALGRMFYRIRPRVPHFLRRLKRPRKEKPIVLEYPLYQEAEHWGQMIRVRRECVGLNQYQYPCTVESCRDLVPLQGLVDHLKIEHPNYGRFTSTIVSGQ